ncbi:unnamed protein product, partial [Rotaria magnacalcarata]
MYYGGLVDGALGD